MIEIAVLFLYALALLLIFLYSLAQLHLLLNYLKANKEKAFSKPELNSDKLPIVTIQLPIYNEKYVVERLLENIAKLDYPKEKLEIQVLDDSTDASLLATKQQISDLKKSGLDIKHIVRKHRKNFKAGALKNGLKTAKGDFIAIFDADFLPKKNWLQQTLPYFENAKIGVVQTRWGHLNRNYSLLTKIQAFALDFHFILEQSGRNFGGHFINFNGTAGIWRKTCILDAGNWQGDTLTEDLDLSYRAQLKNWKFKYLEQVETPAELPITISAARSQQFRWNKGAAENFRKNYFKLLKEKSISWGTKFHGFFHLLNSSMFLVILLLAVLSVPLLFIKNNNPGLDVFFNVLTFFGMATLIFFACYWFAYSRIYGTSLKSFMRFIGTFIMFFSVAMGFSLHNSVAVLEGHFGKKSGFVRTPKFNISGKEKYKLQKSRILSQNAFQFGFEIFLMLYFAYAVFSAFLLYDFSLIPFHLMLFFGFGFVVVKSMNISCKRPHRLLSSWLRSF